MPATTRTRRSPVIATHSDGASDWLGRGLVAADRADRGAPARERHTARDPIIDLVPTIAAGAILWILFRRRARADRLDR